MLVLDRPVARNAMTPAMYFGIRYAISRVNADENLAGLLITDTGDVFAPGGDLGQIAEDNWMDFASTMGMGRHTVRHFAPVGQARGCRRQRSRPRRPIANRHVCRHGCGQ